LMVEDLKLKVADVDRKHTSILASPKADDKTKEQLDQLMTDIRALSSTIHIKLKAIETSISEDTSLKESSAEYRIRKTQHAMMLQRFNETMNAYHSCQVDYREKCKERIKRQLIIARSNMTDEELEEALESGDPAVFTQSFIVETIQAKQSLKDIQARHSDIINLENSIRELKQMFCDIAMLVESQGEIIDTVEYNVQQAVDFTDSAKQQTGKALTYQKKARRKKIFIIICVVVSLIVLALILGLSIGLR